jgi:hypothetical protein
LTVILVTVEKISYAKLSMLQKLILVTLLEGRYGIMKRREFARSIKRLYWGKDSRVATSSLSRALQRLEERAYIRRNRGCWELTDFLSDNGTMLAVLSWVQNRELYALLGLRGPPPEAFGKRAEADGPGVEVDFDL